MRTWQQQAGALAAIGLAAGIVGAGAAPAASAEVDVAVRDVAHDAHRALDITRVEVSQTARAVKVVVKVRDYVGMDSGARVPTALGVHFDTKGDRKPEHLIRIDGMHVAAGSTRDWNKMRSNGFDPWGDWTDCFPRDWTKPFVRSRPADDKVVFNAPRSCLRTSASLRVAVQSYKPYGSKVTADWARGTRRYLPRLSSG